jgi:DNA-binding transcriptional MerR regulator
MTGSPHARAHLSIGEVLSLLQDEFPDVTISKIRFLESQGLLDPERTPSGYRKFYDYDIDRLRWILRLQKDHYLPLKVIKDRLDEAGGMLPFSDGSELAEVEREPSRLTSEVPDGPRELPPTQQIPRTEVPATSTPADATSARQAQARANQGPTRNGRVAVTEREARSGSGGATAPASSPASPVPPSGERHSPASGTPASTRTSSGSSGSSGRAPSSPRGRSAGADNARPGGPASSDGSTPPTARSGSGGGSRSGADGAGGPGSADGAGPRRAPGAGGGGSQRGSSGGPGPSSSQPRSRPNAAANRGPGPRVPASGAAGSGARPAPRRNPPAPSSSRSADSGLGAGANANGHVNYEPGADAVSLTLDELADASGLSVRDVRDLERFGLIEPRVGDSSRYDGDALIVARTAAGFLQHGIEARHMRAYKVAIDREAGMFQQIVSPLLKQRNPDARVRATRTVTELIRLGEVMRGVLLRRELRDHIGGG